MPARRGKKKGKGKSMIDHSMRLTAEEEQILAGEAGETLQKIMETLVRYGDVYGAECMISLDGPIHFLTPVAPPFLKPLFNMLEKLTDEGIHTKLPFTVDPLAFDPENVPAAEAENNAFRMMYGTTQDHYSQLLTKLGLSGPKKFSCGCYFEEVGNVPGYGDNLAWAESSAVVYANSVIGARTNRTSAVTELFSGIIGKTPKFGYLTEDGRKADWIVEIKTSKKPRPQILGSAIGLKVMDQVPYIKGLDKYLGSELTESVKDYLKDMGAATASNGAVALYHAENITPEAKKYGASLIKENPHVYVIDDEELERIINSYPVIWADKDAKPEKAFIGCPHLSYHQLMEWTECLDAELAKAGQEKLKIDTILLSAPDVADKFKETEYYTRLTAAGAHLSSICPAMYAASPASSRVPIITNSNKFRTYSSARYVDDDELARIVVNGDFNRK